MLTIRTKGALPSLCFDGDLLVDWVGGGSYTLDGVEHRSRVHFGYRFDAATSSPDGRYCAVYERLGTKALLLDRGKFVRELNRSYYCADTYEFPIHLFRLPDGRDVLAHCPNEYNRIEIDETASGRRLTESSTREPEDFFHSRLAASPSGTRLLSAGWVWHPWDAVLYFDVAKALQDPANLDAVTPPPASSLDEEGSACWLSDDSVAVGRSRDGGPASLGIVDVATGRYTREFQLSEPAGTLMRVDENHVLSLYRHPKLLSLRTGAVIQAWPELQTGEQTSSICHNVASSVRPFALDALRRRFAVATDEAIFVVELPRSSEHS